MESKILFIGLDVDDKNYHGYAIFENEEQGTAFKTKATPTSLFSILEKFKSPSTTIQICYESTYCGFHLCREIQKAGYECTVIASSLIPEVSGPKVKTDRLDAQKLARYFSKSLLTAVHMPDAEDERNRMLIRSRGFLKKQHIEIKRHIIAICKQLGWVYREDHGSSAAYWTDTHLAWLKRQFKETDPIIRMNFEILISQLDSLENRIEEYAEQIRKLSALPRYKEKVKSLICYRGIDILSAMVFVTELGDIKRFSHPKKLTSYVGLDIIEYSSGGVAKRFSTTKMGNKHVRRILTESVQSATRPVMLSKELKKRRDGVDLKYIDVADRCMKRLHKKATALLYRGKPVNKIKSACAREMLGFIWESLNLVS
ncbi:MAG: IS110 family RNA-guided transposase [Pseudobdellovibrionaceae bacterium]